MLLIPSSVVAAGGGVLNYISGYHRPFPLTEYEIAYPNQKNIVSIPVLIIIALVAPGIIIVILSLTFAAADDVGTQKGSKWRAALWKAHVGCLGLATALATTLFITSGLKDLVGKPRPDLLDRCNADVGSISKYIVGGLIITDAEPLVSSGICQQPDTRFLDDGFAAFPSGHSSFSCAGLLYLSLWLSTRLSVSIPYLGYDQTALNAQQQTTPRNNHTAPPLWEMAVVVFPVVTALFVSASRYADFHHAGIDIFVGAVIGSLIGWASFRMYHLPIRRSQGISTWGPRDKRHAMVARVAPPAADKPAIPVDRGEHGEVFALRSLGQPETNSPTQRSRTFNSDEAILRA